MMHSQEIFLFIRDMLQLVWDVREHGDNIRISEVIQRLWEEIQSLYLIHHQHGRIHHLGIESMHVVQNQVQVEESKELKLTTPISVQQDVMQLKHTVLQAVPERIMTVSLPTNLQLMILRLVM